MRSIRFASYACGNRYYLPERNTAPDTCPRAECAAVKTGVYDDV